VRDLALRKSSAISAPDVDRSPARALLDVFRVGVIIVDQRCRILDANDAGERVLRARDGLQRNGAELCASSARWTRPLRDLVACTARAERVQRVVETLVLPRPSGARALQLLLIALAPDGSDRENGRVKVALFVSDPDAALELPEAQVRRLFGLTQAEAHIAAQLAGGASPREIAAHGGVQINTIRCQLKQIYSKTGARGQRDLVRLLLTGPLVLDLRRRASNYS